MKFIIGDVRKVNGEKFEVLVFFVKIRRPLKQSSLNGQTKEVIRDTESPAE